MNSSHGMSLNMIKYNKQQSSKHLVAFLIQILKCISQLELAQLIGTGVKTRYISGSTSAQTSGGHPIEAFDPEGKTADTPLGI